MLSLSENVLESSELDVVSLLSPSKGAKDARAEAIIGERMEVVVGGEEQCLFLFHLCVGSVAMEGI